jgi:hypothetical protein
MPSHNWLGIVGTMLALIALYLILQNAGGAAQVIGTIGAGTMAIFGTLQGRNVTAYNETVS